MKQKNAIADKITNDIILLVVTKIKIYQTNSKAGYLLITDQTISLSTSYINLTLLIRQKNMVYVKLHITCKTDTQSSYFSMNQDDNTIT